MDTKVHRIRLIQTPLVRAMMVLRPWQPVNISRLYQKMMTIIFELKLMIQPSLITLNISIMKRHPIFSCSLTSSSLPTWRVSQTCTKSIVSTVRFGSVGALSTPLTELWIELASYVGFFCILWFTWCEKSIFIRYAAWTTRWHAS